MSAKESDLWILRKYDIKLPTWSLRDGQRNQGRFLCETKDTNICDSASGRLARVDKDSPAMMRRQVYRMSRYFKNEMGYSFGFYPDEGKKVDSSWVAFIFEHGTSEYEIRHWGYGAICFKYWPEDDPPWNLLWCWLHPAFRNRGLLSSCWGELRAEFGNFTIERPLSKGMQAFLAKEESRRLALWNQGNDFGRTRER